MNAGRAVNVVVAREPCGGVIAAQRRESGVVAWQQSGAAVTAPFATLAVVPVPDARYPIAANPSAVPPPESRATIVLIVFVAVAVVAAFGMPKNSSRLGSGGRWLNRRIR